MMEYLRNQYTIKWINSIIYAKGDNCVRIYK